MLPTSQTALSVGLGSRMRWLAQMGTGNPPSDDAEGQQLPRGSFSNATAGTNTTQKRLLSLLHSRFLR